VFIVGHIRGTSRPKIFPIESYDSICNKPSRTVQTKSGQMDSNYIDNRIKIRKLTPTECERLQGFPDNWTEGISDTQRYKCLGNAVTVNVVKAIIEKLYA